jgi:hypothetical protein
MIRAADPTSCDLLTGATNMTLADLGKPKIIVVQVAVVLAIAGGVWGYSAWSGDVSSEANAVPPELTVEALKTQMDDPGKMMQTMRQTMRREDLTDEQRAEVRRNMREVWQSTMDERVDEYFAAATEKDKNVVLDRQIDEFQERMKEWEARRQEREREREREREARGRDGDADGQQTTESREERGRRWRRFAGSQTREQRKARSESRDPDRTARRMVYFTAMRKRASERGVEMRWGSHGRGSGQRGRGG